MSLALLYKLFGLMAVSLIGYLAARFGAFGSRDASKVLSNTAFLVFGPALLFRTTATMQTDQMPWHLLLAFFAPTLLWMAVVRWWARRPAAQPQHPAAPSVRAMTLGFGNSLQVGIPMAATAFGEQGLQMHLAIVSIHALVLLGAATMWAEWDLARHAAQAQGVPRLHWQALGNLLRGTVGHPVMLPVLAGFAWHALGLTLPEPVDAVLVLLGQGLVPLCLLLVGVSLSEFGLRGALGTAAWLAVAKLLLLPLLVGLCAVYVFGLSGLALGVVVMAAALPVGNNPLLFAQRYGALEGETTAAMMLTTGVYAVTAPLWIAALGWWAARAA